MARKPLDAEPNPAAMFGPSVCSCRLFTCAGVLPGVLPGVSGQSSVDLQPLLLPLSHLKKFLCELFIYYLNWKTGSGCVTARVAEVLTSRKPNPSRSRSSSGLCERSCSLFNPRDYSPVCCSSR